MHQLIESYKKKAQAVLFLDPFASQAFSFQDFKNELQHSSMFQTKKVVALRNVLSKPEFRDKFLAVAKDFLNDDNIFIFYEERALPQADPLFSFFETKGKIYQYQPLPHSELRDWAGQVIAKRGVKINPLALSALIDFVGNDLWRMSSEIIKLTTYKGKAKTIFKEDIELLVKPTIEAVIFKTIDAIASRDKKTALELIYKHLEKGDSPLYILSMINFQFRNLLLAKEFENKPLSEVINTLRPIHPFVIKKSLWLAQKFSQQQLKEIYLKIFKMDLAVKTGKIKPEMALELLIVDI